LRTLVITGQSGFIGSHLVDSLSKKYKIIGISNIKSSLTKIPSNVTQIKQDVRKITEKNLPKNFFCIVHLAALTDVAYCQENPTKCIEVNVNGTQRMLELARKKDSKFLFLSTSHVFGKPIKLPINENHSRIPTSIYSASKLCAENLCEAYSKAYGLDISIIRLFSIYGPKSPLHLVTSKIISQLLTKNVIHLGNVKPKRDFLFINDTIDAIQIVLKKMNGFNSYNVGSGKSHSIFEVYKMFTYGNFLKIN